MQLTDLGWSPFFESFFEEFRKSGYSPLRITRVNRGNFIAADGSVDYTCEVTGKFSFQSDSRENYPAVGDWVAASLLPNEPLWIPNALRIILN